MNLPDFTNFVKTSGRNATLKTLQTLNETEEKKQEVYNISEFFPVNNSIINH